MAELLTGILGSIFAGFASRAIVALLIYNSFFGNAANTLAVTGIACKYFQASMAQPICYAKCAESEKWPLSNPSKKWHGLSPIHVAYAMPFGKIPDIATSKSSV